MAHEAAADLRVPAVHVLPVTSAPQSSSLVPHQSPSAPPAEPHSPHHDTPNTTPSTPPAESATLASSARIPSPTQSPSPTHWYLHYLLTCTRIFAACALVTTVLSTAGWLVLAHIYARIHPMTTVYLELFLRASAAGGALLGACFAFSICAFFTIRYACTRWRRPRRGTTSNETTSTDAQSQEPDRDEPTSASESSGVFPPLHVLSTPNIVLCTALVLVGVAFSAALGMALLPDTITDELGLHEAAMLGGFCAIPGGLGLVSCVVCRVGTLVRTRRKGDDGSGSGEEKV